MYSLEKSENDLICSGIWDSSVFTMFMVCFSMVSESDDEDDFDSVSDNV